MSHPYVIQLDAASTIPPISATTSIGYTIHACQALAKQASVYEAEKRYEHAYVMHKRFVKYYIENVSKHRDFPTSSQSEKDALRGKVDRSIDRLADIKLLLNDKYNEIDRQATIEAHQQQEVENQQRAEAEQQLKRQLVDQSSKATSDIVPSSAADLELEARLQRLMVSESEDGAQRSEIPNNQSSPHDSYQSVDNINVNSQSAFDQPISYKAVTSDNIDSYGSAPSAPEDQASYPPLSSVSYYPVNPSAYHALGSVVPSSVVPSVDDMLPVVNMNKWANLRPEKQAVDHIPSPTQPAAFPVTPSLEHNAIQAAGVPQYQHLNQAPPVQSDNQSNKPSFVQRMFSTKQSLRHLIIPASLMMQFMRHAMANTMNNLETCAVLCGKLSENHLTITHCIFPPQNATADTCVTHDEETLLNVQTKLDLLTLGWIHTHPSQSCFLSSIDLHTQYSYQLMMPESIAIVCAPSQAAAAKHQGIFSINEKGMKLLANCKLNGFHQHAGCEDGDLYGDAQHILLNPRLPCEFIDLRTNRPHQPYNNPSSSHHPHAFRQATPHNHSHNQHSIQQRQPVPQFPSGQMRRGF